MLDLLVYSPAFPDVGSSEHPDLPSLVASSFSHTLVAACVILHMSGVFPPWYDKLPQALRARQYFYLRSSRTQSVLRFVECMNWSGLYISSCYCKWHSTCGDGVLVLSYFFSSCFFVSPLFSFLWQLSRWVQVSCLALVACFMHRSPYRCNITSMKITWTRERWCDAFKWWFRNNLRCRNGFDPDMALGA